MKESPTHIPSQSQSQGASEQVQAVTVVDQEVQSTGTQNEELTTAAEAEEISELDAEKDSFSLAVLDDSDSGSGLESEDEY